MPTFQIQIQNWNEIKWNYYNFKEPNYKTKGAIFKLFMVLLSDIQIHNYNMQGEVKRLIKQGGKKKKSRGWPQQIKVSVVQMKLKGGESNQGTGSRVPRISQRKAFKKLY